MVRYSRELHWSAIFTDLRQSGLTQVEFCELRHIPVHSFRHWLYRLRLGLPPPALAQLLVAPLQLMTPLPLRT
jgi:hypothetical protein